MNLGAKGGGDFSVPGAGYGDGGGGFVNLLLQTTLLLLPPVSLPAKLLGVRRAGGRQRRLQLF